MNTPSKNLSLFPEDSVKGSFDPFFHESMAREKGYKLIAGVDEAGRGPLAGPVVAAAVTIAEDVLLPGVKDSKKMSEKAREEAFLLINETAISIGIGVASHHFIDEVNILNASLIAMKQAVLSLEPAPEYILVDGIHKVPVLMPQNCIKRGDQLSMSISAASIIAKVYRDNIMKSFHDRFPEYGFNKNKGYGTRPHLEALEQYGPCSIHRLTFRRVTP